MIHQAIEYAAKKHDGQKRKGGDIPFIVHPMEVMYYLVAAGADKDTVTAGILHDILEDTPTTYDELEGVFGKRIALLVAAETEDKQKPWAERKAEAVAKIARADKGAMMICCADKLCNLKSIYHDICAGQSVWERFTGTREQTRKVYCGIIDALAPISDLFIYGRLKYYFGKVFGEDFSVACGDSTKATEKKFGKNAENSGESCNNSCGGFAGSKTGGGKSE